MITKRTAPLSGLQKTLKKDHITQLKWLDNQILKNNDSIFLNPKNALTAYTKFKNKHTLIIPDEEIEAFIASRLTEKALKKLVTTLRVAETRSKAHFTLQATISLSSKRKLDYLAKKTGMKKNEIIDKLIEMSDLDKTIKTEEQLEITL
jgi:hypothetical protein